MALTVCSFDVVRGGCILARSVPQRAAVPDGDIAPHKAEAAELLFRIQSAVAIAPHDSIVPVAAAPSPSTVSDAGPWSGLPVATADR